MSLLSHERGGADSDAINLCPLAVAAASDWPYFLALRVILASPNHSSGWTRADFWIAGFRAHFPFPREQGYSCGHRMPDRFGVTVKSFTYDAAWARCGPSFSTEMSAKATSAVSPALSNTFLDSVLLPIANETSPSAFAPGLFTLTVAWNGSPAKIVPAFASSPLI